MAARDSIAYIITLLRAKINDAASDVWTDDELQFYLDMHKTRIRRELLQNDVDQKKFFSAFGLLEGTYNLDTDTDAAWDDDSTIIQLLGDSGSAATSYTPDEWNLTEAVFIFDEDQNRSMYLDAISYNLEGAIAECMEQLAMDPVKARSWARGGVSYTHYDLNELAKYHRSLTGIRSTKLVKTYRTER